SGDLARDLTAQITLMVDAFRGRAGAIMAELIGAAQTDAALADQLRALWIQPRRDAGTILIQGAIDRGELRPDVDIQVALDQLFGPLYFRLLVRHLPLDDPMPAALVRAFLDGAR
ncbi:TetR-like C-terminal domain-containing protein, partial [Parafrankia sp. EUN1f]